MGRESRLARALLWKWSCAALTSAPIPPSHLIGEEVGSATLSSARPGKHIPLPGPLFRSQRVGSTPRSHSRMSATSSAHTLWGMG